MIDQNIDGGWAFFIKIKNLNIYSVEDQVYINYEDFQSYLYYKVVCIIFLEHIWFQDFNQTQPI